MFLHLGERLTPELYSLCPWSLTGPRIPTGGQKVYLGEIVSSEYVHSLEMLEACPKSQHWSIFSNDCIHFFHICEPGISRGKEENEIAKSLRNGWWVWQKCWLSSDTKSVFSKHNCFAAFYIFFVVFFFFLPLYFLWWCFSKWSSFWKLLRYVSAVLKGNRKKGFFSTWIWMLKVQEHEGSGWVGTLWALWEFREEAGWVWAAVPSGPTSPSSPLLLACLDFV